MEQFDDPIFWQVSLRTNGIWDEGELIVEYFFREYLAVKAATKHTNSEIIVEEVAGIEDIKNVFSPF